MTYLDFLVQYHQLSPYQLDDKVLNSGHRVQQSNQSSLPSMDAFPLTDNKELDPSCSLVSLGTCWTSCHCMNKQMDLAVGRKDI